MANRQSLHAAIVARTSATRCACPAGAPRCGSRAWPERSRRVPRQRAHGRRRSMVRVSIQRQLTGARATHRDGSRTALYQGKGTHGMACSACQHSIHLRRIQDQPICTFRPPRSPYCSARTASGGGSGGHDTSTKARCKLSGVTSLRFATGFELPEPGLSVIVKSRFEATHSGSDVPAGLSGRVSLSEAPSIALRVRTASVNAAGLAQKSR